MREGRGSPFQMPVQSTYPSSMSSIIHWPFSGYSYTGLAGRRRQRARAGGRAGGGCVHVSAGVVGGDVARLGDMVVGARVRAEAGSAVLDGLRGGGGEGILSGESSHGRRSAREPVIIINGGRTARTRRRPEDMLAE